MSAGGGGFWWYKRSQKEDNEWSSGCPQLKYDDISTMNVNDIYKMEDGEQQCKEINNKIFYGLEEVKDFATAFQRLQIQVEDILCSCGNLNTMMESEETGFKNETACILDKLTWKDLDDSVYFWISRFSNKRSRILFRTFIPTLGSRGDIPDAGLDAIKDVTSCVYENLKKDYNNPKSLYIEMLKLEQAVKDSDIPEKSRFRSLIKKYIVKCFKEQPICETTNKNAIKNYMDDTYFSTAMDGLCAGEIPQEIETVLSAEYKPGELGMPCVQGECNSTNLECKYSSFGGAEEEQPDDRNYERKCYEKCNPIADTTNCSSEFSIFPRKADGYSCDYSQCEPINTSQEEDPLVEGFCDSKLQYGVIKNNIF